MQLGWALKWSTGLWQKSERLHNLIGDSSLRLRLSRNMCFVSLSAGQSRWLTIGPLQSTLFQMNSSFPYSIFICCSPVQITAPRQWLGDGTYLPMCAKDGDTSYSGLSVTWERASSFQGTLSRHHRIPGLPYLFPSGATQQTTCLLNRRPRSLPHSNTLTAYAKSLSP